MYHDDNMWDSENTNIYIYDISTQTGRDQRKPDKSILYNSLEMYCRTLCTMDVMSRSRLEHCRGFRSDECIFLMHTGHLMRAHGSHAEMEEKKNG